MYPQTLRTLWHEEVGELRTAMSRCVGPFCPGFNLNLCSFADSSQFGREIEDYSWQWEAQFGPSLGCKQRTKLKPSRSWEKSQSSGHTTDSDELNPDRLHGVSSARMTTQTSGTTKPAGHAKSTKLTYFGGSSTTDLNYSQAPKFAHTTTWNGHNFRGTHCTLPMPMWRKIPATKAQSSRGVRPGDTFQETVPKISGRFQGFLRSRRKPEIKQSDHLVLFDLHDNYFTQAPNPQSQNPLFKSFPEPKGNQDPNETRDLGSNHPHHSTIDSIISRDTCRSDSLTRVTGYALSKATNNASGQSTWNIFPINGSNREYITEVSSDSTQERLADSEHLYFSLTTQSEGNLLPRRKLIKMQPKKPVFQGFTITVSPVFVSNIQCVNTNGKLFSLLDSSQRISTSDRLRTILELEILMDPKYVVDVSYPSFEEAKFSSQVISDSLVSPSLLNMTSYDANKGVSEDYFQEERQLESSVLNDLGNESKMSFDELGQVYTNISRKRILSKVQCSNIHFHAHNNGSTSVHHHKTCRKNSQAFTDPNNNMDLIPGKGSGDLGGAIEHTMVVRHPSDLSNFSEQVERDRYQGTLGKLTRGGIPQQLANTYISMPQSDDGHYSSLTHEEQKQQKKTHMCECDDHPVSDNGVKFNPFYVREMRRQSSSAQKSGSRPKSFKQVDSSGLCQVLMDSVMHTSHVAAIHAEQSDCFQCREYMHRFRNGINGMTDPHHGSHRSKESYHDIQKSLDVERALSQLHSPALRYMSIRGPPEKKNKKTKMIAYLSVIFLFILLVTIVIVVLSLYFHQQSLLNQI